MAEKALVKEWFRFANMDLDLAKHTLETMRPAPLEIICFHCQQAAEKFLKGVTVSFGNEPEKVHDLPKLLNTLRNFVSVPDELRRSALQLTQFGAKARYPNDMTVDEAQTKNAVAQAERIKGWAEALTAEQ